MKDDTSERLLLATLVKYGRNSYIEVSDITDENSFTLGINKVIWDVASYIFTKTDVENIIPDMVISHAKHVGVPDFFNENRNLEYLRALFNTPIQLENARPLAKKLAKLSIIRDAQTKLEETRDSLRMLTGDESTHEIMNEIENPILNFSLNLRGLERSFHPIPIKSDLRNHLQFLEENIVDQVGVPTGFKYFDYAIGGGLRREEISIVAARRGRGKSYFSLNVAMHAAMNLGIPCLYLYNEMSREQQLNRMLSVKTGIEFRDIETGKFSKDSRKKQILYNSLEAIEEAPLYIHSMLGLNSDSILSLMKRWIMKDVGFLPNGKTRSCLIIYDYLKMPDRSHTSSGIAEWAAMGDLITQLCNFTEQYSCPMLGLVQLNREGDISQSDRISWVAANVVHIKDIEEADIPNIPEKFQHKVNRKFYFDKRRNADDSVFGAGDFLCINFQGNCGRMTEIGPLSQLNDTNFAVEKDVPFNARTVEGSE